MEYTPSEVVVGTVESLMSVACQCAQLIVRHSHCGVQQQCLVVESLCLPTATESIKVLSVASWDLKCITF